MSSRVGRNPIVVPKGVEIKIDAENNVTVKGPKGHAAMKVHMACSLVVENNELKVLAHSERAEDAEVQAGTVRSLMNSHIIGVTDGFVKKLLLVGVGYRAKVGKKGEQSLLDLTLGKSHPTIYLAPLGIEITVPSATEIEVRGADRQKVGQVAADIRSFRPPEPYKGKGIRYADECIVLKETKKK